MKRHMSRSSLIWGVALLFVAQGCSMFNISVDKTENKSTAAPSSSRSADKDGMKAYDKVITDDMETDEGLFHVHSKDDEYYYEIPEEMLGRDMLLVSRIARTASSIGYGGEKNNTQVVVWERKGDKVLLRRKSYENTASEDQPIFKAVQNSNLEPIILSFDIESLDKDSSGVVINATPLFAEDIPAIGLQEGRRRAYQVRRLDSDRSYIESIRSYPENVEARHVMTYSAGNPPSNSDIGSITLEVNHSMVLLPEEPYQSRETDARVGYISVSMTDYGLDNQKAEEVSYITRWKLVPKDPEAYMRGELVEPIEPIVYYIDPATPEKWRPYLKQGVDDWQKAFEAAGFKNAIMAKDPPTPEENPEFSPEDVRYSVIRYYASPIQNAYGPHVHDPRSGQILESDIGWYHNIMNLLRNWYFVHTAAANPEARGAEFDDEVMGELIRFVSAHEVGHTIGLPHNYGSSYAYPVDSLRSPSFTSNHGTAPTLMDYARFNYIAQPGDGVTQFNPQIGEYDEWAIKWGYTWFGDMSLEEQKEVLDGWVEERADDPRFFYGRQTGSKIDPRSQNEDLGDDAMYASELGLNNLQVIIENLNDWTTEERNTYEDLEELYGRVISQWGRYMGHVLANIGGVYENDKVKGQEGVVYEPVERETQERAVDFLNEHAFSSPTWALNEELFALFNQASVVEAFRARQASVLNQVLDPQRLARLIDYERRSEGTYTAMELMDEVRGGVFSELSRGRAVDVHRRALQRAFVEHMEELMTEEVRSIPAAFRSFYGYTPVDVSQSDIRPLVREQLTTLKSQVDRASSNTGDRMTTAHLNDLSERIDLILDPD
ncbi:MAG TPA: zinc-dependent metalloprotease [Bacteroidetes bacterium]|nr:zinc-dependent metalloprotease [Bacteroidota bacterium]